MYHLLKVLAPSLRVEVFFPDHSLVSGQTASLRVSFPAALPYAKVVFEADDRSLVVTGENRLREKGTFECRQPAPGEPWEAVFTVSVREVKFAFKEPVTVFFHDESSQLICSVSGFIDLHPVYELPGIFAYPALLSGWFGQRVRELRGGTWLTILRSPLMIAAMLTVGYALWLYYSKTEGEREDLLIALKFASPRFSLPAFKEDFMLLSGTTWTTSSSWTKPEDWKVLEGVSFDRNQNPQDGALTIGSSGRAVLARDALAGEALYDFELETKFSFTETSGALGLLVRTQRWSERGYLFLIEPRNGTLTVTGQAIGFFGRKRPLDSVEPVPFRDFPCCETGDYFRLFVTARDRNFDFNIQLESENPSAQRARLVGVSTALEKPVIRDAEGSFRHGSIGFLGVDGRGGAKVEFIEIRLLQPGKPQ